MCCRHVRDHGVLQPTPEQISVYSLWHRFHLPQQAHCTALPGNKSDIHSTDQNNQYAANIDRLMDWVRPEVVSNSLAPTYTYSTVVRNAEGLHQMLARV